MKDRDTARKMSKKGILKILILITAAVLVCLIGFAVLVYSGVILLNNPSDKDFPVKGVDVSKYQGDIDWKVLETQNIRFAFIKATEGSSFVDEKFEYNYKQAQKTELAVGAYHFFSYDSSGKSQAEHFMSVVPKTEKMLPPVIDIEFYGNNEKNPPNKETVQKELGDMVEKLKNHYGCYPIIYAVEKSYDVYIAGSFFDCDIWIRDVIFRPKLSDGRAWTFWQYTNRGKCKGYKGEERFIDMNVFYGTKEDFDNYIN